MVMVVMERASKGQRVAIMAVCLVVVHHQQCFYCGEGAEEGREGSSIRKESLVHRRIRVGRVDIITTRQSVYNHISHNVLYLIAYNTVLDSFLAW